MEPSHRDRNSVLARRLVALVELVAVHLARQLEDHSLVVRLGADRPCLEVELERSLRAHRGRRRIALAADRPTFLDEKLRRDPHSLRFAQHARERRTVDDVDQLARDIVEELAPRTRRLLQRLLVLALAIEAGGPREELRELLDEAHQVIVAKHGAKLIIAPARTSCLIAQCHVIGDTREAMRDLVLELLVGAALILVGLGVVYMFKGDRAAGFDLDLAYAIGALVISVPAIIVMERRRRRKL